MEIFMTPQEEPDLGENILPCLCERDEMISLVCENFENKEAGWITDQAIHFTEPDDEGVKDGVVVKGKNIGMNSSSALSMKNTNNVHTEVDLNLLSENQGQYLLTWNTLIPVNGTAKFIAPAHGGVFTLKGNGQGVLRLFDRYDLRFSYAKNKWLTLELGFEPDRGLYRFRIGDKTYYWLVGAGDHTLETMKFIGTDSGYKVDDICFLKYE